jgi:putative hydrolases of HD superfamily
MVDDEAFAKFFYEAGTLKRVRRSGWWLINVERPESVADHSFRAGVIGYVLAKLEGAAVEKVVLMCMFNDFHEARINDLHKVGHRYIDFKKAETKAHEEQMKPLGEIGDEVFALHTEFQEQKTAEAKVARDADLLENLVQAYEYLKIGYGDARNWIDNVKKLLVTVSAKRLAAVLDDVDPNDWWRELKKSER